MGRLGTFTDQDARTALDVFAPAPDGPDAYRAAHPQATPEELLETVCSDSTFRMPSLLLAEANAAAGGSSFLFELPLASPALGGVLGACHSLDVPLVLGPVRHQRRSRMGRLSHRPTAHSRSGRRIEDPVVPRAVLPPDPGRSAPAPFDLTWTWPETQKSGLPGMQARR
ncbi:hypothetical protein ACWD04_22995 [Streptomyces sp. NPDC002911]